MREPSVTYNMSVCSVLTLIFITLKLSGLIHWSWLWVLAPIWLPIVLFIGALAVVIVVALTVQLFR